VCAPGGGEASIFRDVVGDDRGGDFVHFEAAVGFGNLDGAQPEFAGFFQQVAGNREVLVLDLLGIRQNFVDGKFLRRLPDELVLLAEIFGRENVFGLPRFQQKAAAGNPGLGNCRGRAMYTLAKETAESAAERTPVILMRERRE
jgi:hypothetical protein